jgi:D-sedoheptulose 7-phosphate isomerase
LKDRDRIYLIGNGGSNAICSHLAQDYTKALGFPAQCFSDGSRLTCYINDYGRDEAYAKFLEHFATSSSLVILISSSGNSTNILTAAEWCVQSSVSFIILSGFDQHNDLRQMYSHYAKLDFYVPSEDYGIVENVHSIFLHSVI